MKRINIFVLLCVFIFSFCAGVAAAEDNFTTEEYQDYLARCAASSDNPAIAVIVPLVDNDETGGKKHEMVPPDDYYLHVIPKKDATDDNNPDGSATKPYILQLQATGAKLHKGGNDVFSYWVGVAISGHAEGYKYQQGKQPLPETVNITDNDKGDQSFDVDSNTYMSINYGTNWPDVNSPSLTFSQTSFSDKEGYVVRKKGSEENSLK